MQHLTVGALAFAVGLSAAAEEKAARPAAEPVKLSWPSGSARPARLLASLGKAAGTDIRLARPFGAAVDDAERVYVADPSQRAVVVYDRKSGTASRWTGNARFPVSGPVALALDRSGRLFVADGFAAQVVVFDRSGTPAAVFGKDLLKRPGGIAIDSRNGLVWVEDVRENRVLAFDLRTFAPGRSIGGEAEQGKVAPRFSSPVNLAVNGKGQLLVSDMWNCRVQVFAPDGALVRRFPTQCAREGQHGRANLIAVDGEDRVYVAGPEGGSLQIFGPDGTPSQFVPSLGPPAKMPAVRTGLAIDSHGRIYVVEQAGGEGRVQIYSQSSEARADHIRAAQSNPGPPK